MTAPPAQAPATGQPIAVTLASPSAWAVTLALLPVLLVWLPVLGLKLTPALFAALIFYGGTRALATRLNARWPALRHAEGWALALLVALSAALVAALAEYAADVPGHARANGSLANLLQTMAVTLEQLRGALPAWAAQHVPASIEALREAVTAWLRSHAAQVQTWGGHTLRGLGYGLIGAVVGGMAALQLPRIPTPPATTPPLVQRLRRAFDELVESFTSVVFAQVRIAAINAALTGVFLLGTLPAVGHPMPMAGTLVALTFVTGLIPVLGNLISNAVIFTVGLSVSAWVAVAALSWLVVIHKLEYFLNAHIIGQRIHAKAWELLIVMLVMEAVFGVAGLISAPVVYAQIKRTLIQRGWLG